MSNRTYAFLFLVLLLTGCSSGSRIDSKDVVITQRLFSPDSSYVAIEFYWDHGAMGQSLPRTALLRVEDTTNPLTDYILPCFPFSVYACYYPDQWLDNKTLQVFLNERPFVKEGIPFKGGDVVFNGIRLKVTPFDQSLKQPPIIEYFSLSDDKKKIMVAYRYKGVSELNISVFGIYQTLPRIGNVYTCTEASWNPVVFVTWNGSGLDFMVKNTTDYNPSDYLNKKINVPVRFVDIRNYKGKPYEDGYWTDTDLYNSSYVDSLLSARGKEVEAEIIDVQSRLSDQQSQFYYEYAYTVDNRSYRSYFVINREFSKEAVFKEGDRIRIVYLPGQPLIHRTIDTYGRKG